MNYELKFDKTVTRWDEAVPMGNGLMGCLIWGDGSPLKFSLDRGDLWDTRPAKETLDENYTYKELIDLVKNKKQNEIVKRFDNFYSRAIPTKIPAGRIELKYLHNADNVESSLDLSCAQSTIKLNFGSYYSKIKSFIHATDKYGYIKISGIYGKPQVKLINHDFTMDNDKTKKPDVFNNSTKLLDYPNVEKYKSGNVEYFIQKTKEDFEFGIFVTKELDEKGNLNIVYFVGCSNDGDDWKDKAIVLISDALKKGYDSAIETHKIWWKNFWSKSSVSIPDMMYEKQWYLINYLFASCSRKGTPPMPLQGVWTADEGKLPPWKGDYHNDLNTQLSYMHFYKANHLEEGESFIDFLWNLVPQARKFAKEFFDAPGLCLPSVMSIKGQSLGGWPMYSTNLTNQIWLCQSFVKYWEYTGERQFLEEKAYPYLKETAECILRWLKEDEDGKLKLPLSSSPEIHDNTLKAWVRPNSNYDTSLLMYLFKNLERMSKQLNLDKSIVQKWEEIYNKLPQLAIDNRNVLMVNEDECLQQSHRHHSQAMAIYPLNLLNYNNENDKKIIDATIQHMEILGTGWWVGFSFTWMSEFYARQYNGQGAAYQLKLFFENYCSQNGFHLNGDFKKRGTCVFHYRPFTLEANMCAADALQEMLLQSYDGIIRVFPAIPNEWKEKGTSFDTFRAEKGVLVSSKIDNNKLEYIKLHAEIDGIFKVENRFNSDILLLKYKNSREKIKVKKGEIFEIKLKSGEYCTIIDQK